MRRIAPYEPDELAKPTGDGYIRLFFKHWKGAVTGSVSILFASLYTGSDTAKLVAWIVGGLCVLFVAYRVWADERGARISDRANFERVIAGLTERATEAEKQVAANKAVVTGRVIQCGALNTDDEYTECWFYGELTGVGIDTSVSLFRWSFHIDAGSKAYDGVMTPLVNLRYPTHGNDGKIFITQWLKEDAWLFGQAAKMVPRGQSVSGHAGFYVKGLDPKQAVANGTRWTITCEDHEGNRVSMEWVFDGEPHEIESSHGSFISDKNKLTLVSQRNETVIK